MRMGGFWVVRRGRVGGEGKRVLVGGKLAFLGMGLVFLVFYVCAHTFRLR